MSVGIAALLAGVLLYYSLRGIEWREVARIATRASFGKLVLAAAVGSLTLLLRALRWRILLNAEGEVSISSAFWGTVSGYFGNNFLPARGGELVRIYMISSRHALETAYVLATAVCERVADAIALVVIAAVVLLTLPAPPDWLAGAARPFAILAVLGALAIGFLPRLGSATRTMIERAPLPEAWRSRLIQGVEQALRGMRAFHDARRLSGFVALTAIIWCLDAVVIVVTARALGLPMPTPAAFLLTASLGLGSALPSTPGYVGIYQFVAVTVLGPFGFSRTDAIAYILVAQAVSFIVIGFWGSLGIMRYRRTRLAD